MSAFFATLEDTVVTSDQYNFVTERAVPTVKAFFQKLLAAVAIRLASTVIMEQMHPWFEKAEAWFAKMWWDQSGY